MAHRVSRIVYLILLGRPHFLVGGVVFHGLGIAIALYAGATLNVPALFWGQFVVSSIQLMTHYSNDYFDFAADRANPTPSRWSGGSRVLPDGHLPPSAGLIMAALLAVSALAGMVILRISVQATWLAVAIMALALVTAWEYSAPPLRLHSRGVGELTTALLVPGLTTLVGFTLQMGRLTWYPVIIVLPLCAFQFAMTLSVHFPDAEGDRAAGKGTLVVRLGGEAAARLYISALVLAYVLQAMLLPTDVPVAVVAAGFLGLPVAIWQVRRVGRGSWAAPDHWNSLAFWSIGLLVGTAAIETIAFLWITLNP